jgi:hypothetical protein
VVQSNTVVGPMQTLRFYHLIAAYYCMQAGRNFLAQF